MNNSRRCWGWSMTVWLAASWLLAGWLVVRAEPSAAQAVPPLTKRVNDYANLLSQPREDELESRLRDHEQRTGNQVAVLTITSLEGAAIETFALEVVESWRLGQAGKDNGALLLVAANDRELRIEVGYGLEPYITDAVSGRIIREQMVPRFRAGDFETGIMAGANAMLAQIEGIEDFGEAPDAKDAPANYTLPGAALSFLSAIFGLVVWRKRRRSAPRKSAKTGLMMRRLSEQEEDQHLDAGQQMEESIGSVDYDVWSTGQPHDINIIAYRNHLNFRYRNCPHCGYRTYYHARTEILRPATYAHSGHGERHYACKHCDHTERRRYHIPRLQRSTTVVIGGGRGGGGGFGGGFGGGGFSGGGGGSFGGGGASGRW